MARRSSILTYWIFGSNPDTAIGRMPGFVFSYDRLSFKKKSLRHGAVGYFDIRFPVRVRVQHSGMWVPESNTKIYNFGCRAGADRESCPCLPVQVRMRHLGRNARTYSQYPPFCDCYGMAQIRFILLSSGSIPNMALGQRCPSFCIKYLSFWLLWLGAVQYSRIGFSVRI